MNKHIAMATEQTKLEGRGGGVVAGGLYLETPSVYQNKKASYDYYMINS